MKNQFTPEELYAWGKQTREDLRMIPTMAKNGFTISFAPFDIVHQRVTPETPPCYPVSFLSESISIYQIGSGFQWINFECGTNNKRKYNTLKELLTKLNFQK